MINNAKIHMNLKLHNSVEAEGVYKNQTVSLEEKLHLKNLIFLIILM